MKNWARKFNPHRTGYRTPALFRLRKNQQIKKAKASKSNSRQYQKSRQHQNNHSTSNDQ